MAVVEVRELAFIDERLAQSAWLVAWADVFEARPAFARVANHLIDAIRRRVAVVQLREFALVDDRARSTRIPLIVDWARAFGVAVHQSADFVEMHLALIRPVDAAFGWRRSWARHAQSSRMSRAVRGLIQELRTALTRIALL